MKLLTVLIILPTLLFTGKVLAQLTTGTCATNEVTNFVTSELGFTCGLSFAMVDPTDSLGLLVSDVPSRSRTLDTLCTAECAGTLVQYLETCCADSIQSQGLVSWCTPTGNDSPGRDRCYFALPPVLNLTSFSSIADDCTITGLSCPSQCSDTLRSVVDTLGCCYQSFYNNPTFIQAAQEAGFITSLQALALSFIGSNDFVWTFCNVQMPNECSGEPFPRADTSALINVADACPATSTTESPSSMTDSEAMTTGTSPTTRSIAVTTPSSFQEGNVTMTKETVSTAGVDVNGDVRSTEAMTTTVTSTQSVAATEGALAVASLNCVVLVNMAVITATLVCALVN